MRRSRFLERKAFDSGWRAAGLFAALSLLFWLPPLLGRHALFHDALFRLFYPNAVFFANAIKAGSFPFWNPFLYSGVPFLANLQSAALYPATYLHLILSFPVALALNTALHTVVAALGMFVLARRLGLAGPASLAAGIAFGFNGFFILHYVFPSQVHAYAWLPLILYFLRESEARTRLILSVGLAALALTLQVLAGHPQFVFYTCLILAVDIVYPSVIRANASGRKGVITAIGVMAVLALAWSLAQLAPALDLARESPRVATNDPAWLGAYSVGPGELARMLALPVWNRYFTPTSGDPHIVSVYFGIPVLALAVVGLVKAPSRFKRQSRVLAIIAGLGLVLAMGRYLPFYGGLRALLVPLQYFRFPAQASYLACFGLSLAAGIGLQALLDAKRDGYAIVALIAVDLWLFSTAAIKTIETSFYEAKPESAAFIQSKEPDARVLLTPRSRRHAMNQRATTRLDASLGFHDALLPNLGMTHGIHDADGYEELRFHRYDRVLAEIEKDPLSRWMDILGVRFLLTYWNNLPSKFTLTAQAPLFIYENLAAYPRAYAVRSATTATDEKILEVVRNDTAFNFRDRVLIDGPSGENAAESGEDQVTLERPTLQRLAPGRFRIDSDALGPRWIVVAESFDRGWSATVNGAPAPVYRANLVQMAVRTPPGRAEIELRYRPKNFAALAGLSIGTFLVFWIVAFAGSWPRRSTNHRPPPYKHVFK